jgi:hypothetical protein
VKGFAPVTDFLLSPVEPVMGSGTVCRQSSFLTNLT